MTLSRSDTEPVVSLKGWALTSLIAAFVAFLDIGALYIGLTNTQFLYWSIAAEGIITFFGMLIVSSFYARYKPNSKGTMRKAIASSLILVYVILLALTFSGRFGTADTVFQNVLEGFSLVIMTIIGFYFGSKGALEVVSLWKNKTMEDSASKTYKL